MDEIINNNEDKNILDEITKKLTWDKFKMPYVNIMVVGKTGSGKSTLINAIFKENLCQTGIGSPVTSRIKLIEKEGFPIRIYDTKGLELNTEMQTQTKKEINNIIRNKLESGNTEDYIHIILYCINCAGNRIEESEINWIILN